MRAVALSLACLLAACAEPPPPEATPSATPVDPLASLAGRRDSSAGAQLQAQLDAARALNRSSTRALALAADEDYPTAAKAGSSAAPRSGGGSVSDIATAGESAPSDLDMADISKPRASGGYIDMDGVSAAIRAQRSAVGRCRDKHEAGAGSMEFTIRVGAGGVAQEVHPKGRGPLADCLAGVLKRTHYPKVYKGEVTFTYPLRY